MGTLARRVQARLRDGLADRLPTLDWATERRLGRTPVDVFGRGNDRVVAVELEVRRADPVANTAKLFRHLEGRDARADVVQVFSGYHDLADGGVSAKRLDAEFVGRAAAEAVAGLAYHPVGLDVDPPRGDAAPPEGWERAVDGVCETVCPRLRP